MNKSKKIYKEKRVFVTMVGDLFHYGHVRFLKKARKLGDYLVVGVHSDYTVKKYKGEPVMNMKERIEVIESCRYVDKLVPNAPINLTDEYLKKYKIDIVAHAHRAENAHKYEFLFKNLKKIKFIRLNYTSKISSSNIKKRIKNRNF